VLSPRPPAGRRNRFTSFLGPMEIALSLESSYRQLPRDAARAYRLLALCPGPDLTAGAAAAVLGNTGAGPVAASLAGELVSAGLIEEPVPGRFRFVELALLHARRVAGQEEDQAVQDEAVARAAEWYLTQSARADLAVAPHRQRYAGVYHRALLRGPWPGDASTAMAWLGTERLNLAAAQHAAAARGLHWLAWQFADTLWGYVLHGRDHVIWAEVYETALASAQACDDLLARYVSLIRLAAFERATGDCAAARDHALEARDASRAAGNQDAEASSLGHVGLAYLDAGDPATAVTWFRAGLGLYALAGGNPRGQAILHRHRARARISLDDLQTAAEDLDAVLDTFRGLGDFYAQAATCINIGELHLAAGDPGQAVTVLEEALPLADRAASGFIRARILTVLAQASIQTGDTGRARACLAEASQLHDQLRLPAGARPDRSLAGREQRGQRVPDGHQPGPAGT